MPEEAELATPPPEAQQYKSWDGTRVPPSVFAALTEKYRGQKGIGTKQVEVLDFFTETARLKGVGQTTMSGGGGGSPPPTLTREKNVETVFKLKVAPDSSTSALVAAYGQINASRMMKHVLLSKDVPDQQKVALCTGRTAADPTKWLEEYRAKQSAQPPFDAVQTLDTSESETLAPAEKNARKRQQVLGERAVMKLTAARRSWPFIIPFAPSFSSAVYRSSASSTGHSLLWSARSTLRTFHTCSNGPPSQQLGCASCEPTQRKRQRLTWTVR